MKLRYAAWTCAALLAVMVVTSCALSAEQDEVAPASDVPASQNLEESHTETPSPPAPPVATPPDVPETSSQELDPTTDGLQRRTTKSRSRRDPQQQATPPVERIATPPRDESALDDQTERRARSASPVPPMPGTPRPSAYGQQEPGAAALPNDEEDGEEDEPLRLPFPRDPPSKNQGAPSSGTSERQ